MFSYNVMSRLLSTCKIFKIPMHNMQRNWMQPPAHLLVMNESIQRPLSIFCWVLSSAQLVSREHLVRVVPVTAAGLGGHLLGTEPCFWPLSSWTAQARQTVQVRNHSFVPSPPGPPLAGQPLKPQCSLQDRREHCGWLSSWQWWRWFVNQWLSWPL